MLTINKGPGQRVLELGGGQNRNPAADVNVDVRSGPGVDFCVDFDKPDWPIGSNEFDCVFSHFALEHVCWRNTRQAVKEIYRATKPGGKAVIIVPNTEAQVRWIRDHPDGWDGKGFFESASENLFGSQDYGENAHKSYWSPSAIDPPNFSPPTPA